MEENAQGKAYERDNENAQESEREEPIFFDTLFHRRKKHGKWDVVEAPEMPVLVADTHAHVHTLPDPALSLARAGLHSVGFIELITDVSEDGTAAFDGLKGWERQAGVNMHRMFSRC